MTETETEIKKKIENPSHGKEGLPLKGPMKAIISDHGRDQIGQDYACPSSQRKWLTSAKRNAKMK